MRKESLWLIITPFQCIIHILMHDNTILLNIPPIRLQLTVYLLKFVDKLFCTSWCSMWIIDSTEFIQVENLSAGSTRCDVFTSWYFMSVSPPLKKLNSSIVDVKKWIKNNIWWISHVHDVRICWNWFHNVWLIHSKY